MVRRLLDMPAEGASSSDSSDLQIEQSFKSVNEEGKKKQEKGGDEHAAGSSSSINKEGGQDLLTLVHSYAILSYIYNGIDD